MPIMNMDKWLEDVKKQSDLRERFTKADLPDLPTGVGEDDAELIAWVVRKTNAVKQFFEAQGAGGRLLQVDLDKDDETIKGRLENFLGCKVPWQCKTGAPSNPPKRPAPAGSSDYVLLSDAKKGETQA